ncbi:hypothetical protein SPACI_011780 [Sporomusa acidovorans DSM 3132]|uniref:Glycosyltransferase RgtA/B/C/D-like domain-containing protein n=2 Tax=Sporomusa TaxID=2375 RepID=A0ABZ3IZ32_SPOA4|nr:hypothetical protein [Sporomusa acidovorans]OZC17242.1 hypothetical protein SPACI_38920 [Sporomusa acidovorans DSM 3132]SDF15522.1 hypothetical protein SAMN04488499_103525 [Sporomusa acidovorans]
MSIFLLFTIIEGLLLYFIKINGLHLNGDVISWIIITLSSIGLFTSVLYKYKRPTDSFFVTVLCLAYVLRIFALLWDIYARDIWLLPNSGLDSEFFQNSALDFAIYNDSNAGMVTKTFGLFYRYFGEYRILLQYLNLLCSIFTIMLCNSIFNRLEISDKSKKIGLFLISFLPNYIILSVILLRESLMIFILALSLYFFIRWWKSGVIANFVLACALSFFAAMYHSGGITNAIGYAVVYVFYNHKKKDFQFSFKSIVSGTLLLTLFLATFINYGNVFFGYVNRVDSVSVITTKVVDAGGGRSGYDHIGGANVTSLSELLLYTPIRMLYFVASPLPWDWRGINDIIAFVFSSMFYFLVLYMALKVLKSVNIVMEKKTLIIALLIINLFGMALFAWGVSNAGTALRHRDKYIAQYVILLTICLTVKSKSLKGIRSIKNNA